jgi:hypothetical protein
MVATSEAAVAQEEDADLGLELSALLAPPRQPALHELLVQAGVLPADAIAPVV